MRMRNCERNCLGARRSLLGDFEIYGRVSMRRKVEV